MEALRAARADAERTGIPVRAVLSRGRRIPIRLPSADAAAAVSLPGFSPPPAEPVALRDDWLYPPPGGMDGA